MSRATHTEMALAPLIAAQRPERMSPGCQRIQRMRFSQRSSCLGGHRQRKLRIGTRTASRLRRRLRRTVKLLAELE